MRFHPRVRLVRIKTLMPPSQRRSGKGRDRRVREDSTRFTVRSLGDRRRAKKRRARSK